MSRSFLRRIGVGLLGVALIGGVALPASASERVRKAEVVRVIDGDTFVIAGGERVRVRNFDTPELRRYDCREERVAAVAARDAARRALLGRTVTLRVTGEDRYRRKVADVAVHGPRGRQDFADWMVAGGYGAHWRYGREPQPDWCPVEAKSANAWRVAWNLMERAISGAVGGARD